MQAVKFKKEILAENMLENIATTRSQCNTICVNKISYYTDYIIPDLTDFLGNDEEEIRKEIGKINIKTCEKYCTD